MQAPPDGTEKECIFQIRTITAWIPWEVVEYSEASEFKFPRLGLMTSSWTSRKGSMQRTIDRCPTYTLKAGAIKTIERIS